MSSITGEQVMICERFIQVLLSPRGYEKHSHIMMTSITSWINQRNTLDEQNADDILESNENDFLEAVKDFAICAEELLLGPEMKIAQNNNIPTLHALLHFMTYLTKKITKNMVLYQ